MIEVQVTFSHGRTEYVHQSYAIIPRQNDIIEVKTDFDSRVNGKYLVTNVILLPQDVEDTETVVAEVLVTRLR